MFTDIILILEICHVGVLTLQKLANTVNQRFVFLYVCVFTSTPPEMSKNMPKRSFPLVNDN